MLVEERSFFGRVYKRRKLPEAIHYVYIRVWKLPIGRVARLCHRKEKFTLFLPCFVPQINPTLDPDLPEEKEALAEQKKKKVGQLPDTLRITSHRRMAHCGSEDGCWIAKSA
jgi:hypothetical protein